MGMQQKLSVLSKGFHRCVLLPELSQLYTSSRCNLLYQPYTSTKWTEKSIWGCPWWWSG